MHPLEAYYSGRSTAIPSTTQNTIRALENGGWVDVPCRACKGEKTKKAKSKKYEVCNGCLGRGSAPRRYDVVEKTWREGVHGQTRACPKCLGVSPGCEACEHKGYQQALDAIPKGAAAAECSDETGVADAAIEVGWVLRRLPEAYQDALAVHWSAEAVSWRNADTGHMADAPLLPLTRLGQLAHRLKGLGREAEALATLEMAYGEATRLRRAAMRAWGAAWRVATKPAGNDDRLAAAVTYYGQARAA
jgi:hypothetical protein